MDDDDDSGEDIEDIDSIELSSRDRAFRTYKDDDKAAMLKDCSFSSFANILTIGHTHLRIICYYLGIESPKDISRHANRGEPLIASILMETVPRFMESRGYVKDGQLNFNNQGDLIPCGSESWSLRGKNIKFTNSGYLFFKDLQNKDDKFVFELTMNIDHGYGSISVYHQCENKAKSILLDLDEFAKENNCLKGCNLASINIYASQFSEVKTHSKYAWHKYYYDESIKDLFDLEVFGFLKDTDKYSKVGITKRGILLYGRPGTGKTTIGHIICNNTPDITVVWITPDTIRACGESSISVLYKFAQYLSPVVMILEDLDLFAEDRIGHTDSLRVGTLMNVLDGVNAINNAVTVATTNRIELVEKALSNRPGRFDRKIEIGDMSEDLRTKMVKDRLGGFSVDDGTFQFIIEQSDGWSGAEIQEFINTINLYFIQHDIKDFTLNCDIVKNILGIVNTYGATTKKNKISLRGRQK